MALSLVSNVYNFSHHKSNAATAGMLIHQHECYELYYFVSGNMHFIYDGTEYALTPHTMILIAPEALHGIQILTDETYERYTFHFVPEMFAKERQATMQRLLPTLRTVRKRNSPLPFFLEHSDQFNIRSVLDTILAIPERHSDPEMQYFLASSLFENLFVYIYATLPASPVLPKPAETDPAELAPILDYFRRHPSDRISLDRLSEKFYISRSQLNNLFQRYFKTSVMEYVKVHRLEYAQKLLLNGIPAAEVASAVGYEEYSTFYRAYQKHFGHSPTQDKGIRKPDYKIDGWLPSIPFDDPGINMQARENREKMEFPDISFENNAYEPLEGDREAHAAVPQTGK